jgi:hypothetical protein
MWHRFAACLLLLTLLAFALAAQQRGVQPGTTVPPFRLPDQTGTLQDLNSIRGSNGAVLVFYRSADW